MGGVLLESSIFPQMNAEPSLSYTSLATAALLPALNPMMLSNNSDVLSSLVTVHWEYVSHGCGHVTVSKLQTLSGAVTKK